MFAFVVVGFFILMIFSAEFFKMWRRETEYRRARQQRDDDVDELRDQAWRGPGPGQPSVTRSITAARPITPAATMAQRTPAPAAADLQTGIQRERRAVLQDARTFEKRRREEAPEVYPAGLEPATANDEGGPDDEEVRPRTTH